MFDCFFSPLANELCVIRFVADWFVLWSMCVNNTVALFFSFSLGAGGLFKLTGYCSRID